jgi:hypothetical protein
MNHLDKIELIEQYHNGSLVGESLSDFEAQMAASPDFAAEVDDYCSVLLGFDMLHLEAFEAQLQGFEARACAAAQQTPIEPQAQIEHKPLTAQPVKLQASKGGRWFGMRNVAATVAFLIFIPVSYFMLMGQGTRFDEHFSPSAALIHGERNAVQHTAQLKACQAAFTAYNTPKNYANALPLLQKYAADYGMTPQIELYIGVSYLYLEQVPTAISHLSIVANQNNVNNIDQRQEAEYMLALAYFRQNEIAKTKELLVKIEAQEYHNFKKQAAKLSAELPK